MRLLFFMPISARWVFEGRMGHHIFPSVLPSRFLLLKCDHGKTGDDRDGEREPSDHRVHHERFQECQPQNKAKGNTAETPVRIDTKSTLIIIDLPLIKLAVGESLCFSFSYSMYPAEER